MHFHMKTVIKLQVSFSSAIHHIGFKIFRNREITFDKITLYLINAALKAFSREQDPHAMV